MRRVFALAFLIIATLVLVAPPVTALMGPPEDRFNPASPEQRQEIEGVGKLRWLIARAPLGIHVMQSGIEGAAIYVVRLCHPEDHGLCPTAFFLHEISDKAFHGVVTLPRLTTWGDYSGQLGPDCGPLTPLFFVSPKEASLKNAKGVAVSRCGFLF